MYVSYDNKNLITAISEHPFSSTNQKVVKVNKKFDQSMIGKPFEIPKKKDIKDLKVAVVCNWKDTCGIATYTEFLTTEIKQKVKHVKIFAEVIKNYEKEENVSRCWKRGEPLTQLVSELEDYNPDFIIIQHEFGIFPKATHFLKFLQGIENFPYVLTLHSVYEHLDKAVCTAAIKNIVVHTDEGKDVLESVGNTSNVFVIPHGCIQIPEKDRTELWNIFQTPYCIVQFGFGFSYKGVDTALEAVAVLKKAQPEKYKDIFYCYLCSENANTSSIHTNYYYSITTKIKELGLSNNASIIRKYQSEKTINNYLRTAKLALFPYKSDPNNVVYGASGATRIAMANGTPTIVGKNHQFDDLEGVLPRAGTAEELAHEIDKVFSSRQHRDLIVKNAFDYIEENTWNICADKYLDLYKKV